MKVLIPLVLLVVGLAGCAGQGASSGTRATAPVPGVSAAPATAEPAPAASAPSTVTAADLDAMARRVFPGDHPAGCGDMAACPVTDRLRARLVEISRTPPGQPGPLTQFCRCQNGADGMSVASEVNGAGGVAHVALRYGTSSTSKLDLIFVRLPDSRLLLDDTQCTGRGPSTSLYAPELAACQV